MIVYKITNKTNGMVYIGQTIHPIHNRWLGHIHDTKNKTLYPFQNAIKKYGKDNFSIETIGTYTNLEDLNNAEEYFIEWHNSIRPNGYNLRSGGKNGGKLHQDTKNKIINKLTGKTHTLKTKQKMSKAHKGHIVTKETRDKISRNHTGNPKIGVRGSKHPNFGKSPSLERRLRISLAQKGKHNSSRTEFKKDMISINKGIKLSEERRGQMSLARKGVPNPKNRKPSPRKGKTWFKCKDTGKRVWINK